MNPFERINEMKEILKTEITSNNINKNDFIALDVHYKKMMNMLNILEKDLKNAEYNYEVESINHEVTTFEEHVVLERKLNDNVVIFQPVNTGDTLAMADIESLIKILTELRNNNIIKEDIIVLPPDVNVFRAKLATSKQDEESIEDI